LRLYVFLCSKGCLEFLSLIISSIQAKKISSNQRLEPIKLLSESILLKSSKLVLL
jgi:hypothetical protein